MPHRDTTPKQRGSRMEEGLPDLGSSSGVRKSFNVSPRLSRPDVMPGLHEYTRRGDRTRRPAVPLRGES